MSSKKLKFASTLADLKRIEQAVKQGSSILLVGKSTSLQPIYMSYCIEIIQKQNFQTKRLDCTKILPEDLELELCQSDLFGTKEYILTSNLSDNKKALQRLTKVKPIKPVVCSIPNLGNLKFNTDKQPWHIVKFGDIPTNELTSFVIFLSGLHKRPFANDAIKFLVEWIGNDPCALNNEIKNLSLIFASLPQSEALTSKKIEPYCSCLKTDKAFELLNLALKRDTVRVQAMLDDLVVRGEHPLAILGIIIRFVRQCILVKSNPNSSHLPDWLAKSYSNFARSTPSTSFAEALNACQFADLQFKTSSLKGQEVELLYRPLKYLLKP